MPPANKGKGMKRHDFTIIELLVVISIIVLLASLLLPALGRAKESGQKIRCAGNLKNYALGMEMYTSDCAGLLPSIDNDTTLGGTYWIIAISPYIDPQMPDSIRNSISLIGRALLPCPKIESSSSFAYAYNAYLNASNYGGTRCWKRISNIPKPSETPTIMDHSTRTIWNTNATWYDPATVARYRHINGANILFLDGHSAWYRSSTIRADFPDKFFPDAN